MKSLIPFLLAVVVSSAAFGAASADDFKIKPINTVNVTFERAICVPGLVVAMLQQLNDGSLENNQLSYVFEVMYQGTLYRISGSYEQWLLFFKLKWKYPIDR